MRKNLIPNLIAGLTTAIADIPDAMASAVLAGANPVYGLYAIMVGKPVGGLLTSSHFMTLAVTSAMALTAGSALIGLSGEEHARALFTLTVMVGGSEEAFSHVRPVLECFGRDRDDGLAGEGSTGLRCRGFEGAHLGQAIGDPPERGRSGRPCVSVRRRSRTLAE